MLDSVTKRKIDTARDILVGKVPDPKSQIEQITLALIYKFMNDTDKTSVELGGKPSYFIADYERFSWDNIIDPRLTGQERMNLYTEGLERMGRNPHLPELFRNVFKNAFLPFRSPETLNMFLEEIDGFQYDHSERLGDAYEYLLSIMSSQGDAGQFRTPRHIIDFIVKVVDPQKEDTILDPACGTAGFLISAIKHIQHHNTKDITGDLLDIEDKRRLADSVVGYEISPDMRRISLVNMFLHQIPEPHIYEYDTLSSQDRWDDDFSCVLANPPFMSPKGGIRPHERFGIKSSRSEVLFVDYIMEHLTIDGKAGVIVPEGVIFQSQNAFQNLRKKMVEDCFLWAVVSLPSGVFNPYSGVKTSILFFDRHIAKSTDKVLFVNIDADGYGLGAQRKPTEMNDLPEAYNNLLYFKKHYQELPPQERTKLTGNVYLAHTATKADIKSQDYILSANRYLIPEVRTGKWQRVKLGEVCSFEYGRSLPENKRILGNFPVLGSNGRTGFHNDFIVKGPAIIIGRKGSSGEVTWEDDNCYPIDTTYYVKVNDDSVILKYLYYFLKSSKLKDLSEGAGIPGLNRNDAYNKQIPLPPLEVQKEIVAEIESYQKIIDGAKQIIANWKPKIDIDPDWQIVKLGDVCDVKADIIHSPQPNGIYIGADSIEPNTGTLIRTHSIKQQSITGPVYQFKGTKLLYSKLRPYLNKLCIAGFDGYCSSDMYPLEFKESVLIEYAQCYMLSDSFMKSVDEHQHRARMPKINREQLFSIPFPLAPFPIQQQIVSRIEEEQSHIESCKKLIAIYQSKIQDRINKVWEE